MKDVSLADFAMTLGIEPNEEPHLLGLAEECMASQLPEGWTAERIRGCRTPVYRHTATGNVKMTHPLDEEYRNRANALRKILAECGTSALPKDPSESDRQIDSLESSDDNCEQQPWGNWPQMLFYSRSKSLLANESNALETALEGEREKNKLDFEDSSSLKPASPISPISPKVVKVRPNTVHFPSNVL